MKFLTSGDISSWALEDPVIAGEYTSFKENFEAAYDATSSLETGGSEKSMMRDQYDPIINQIQEHAKWQRYEVTNYFSDPNFYKDEEGKAYTGIRLPSKRIYDYAQENDDFKQMLLDQGYDISTPDNLYQYLEQMAAEKAADFQAKQQKVAQKQTTMGTFGEFVGSTLAYMTDPADVASMAIGFSSGAGLVRKIAEATAVNVGVELFDYPNVRQWHKRVTGEDYSPAEFAKNAGLITAGTGVFVTALHIPYKKYVGAIQERIGRTLTPQETLEGLEAFKIARDQKYGVDHTTDKTLDKLDNKTQADEIVEKDNYMEGDPNNTKHNTMFIQTIRAIINNDYGMLPKGRTAQVKVPKNIDEFELVHSGQVEEIDLDKLIVNPEEYQFKTDKAPIEGELDPVKTGQILIFETRDGDRILIDGFGRVAEAKAQGVKLNGVVLREMDGFTPATAKISGIVKNFYDGTISKTDMKVFGKYPGLLDIITGVTTSNKASAGLAKLGAKPFIATTRGVISPDAAVLVGDMIEDEVQQLAMMDIIKKSGKTTDEDITKLIDEAIANKTLDNYDMAEIDPGLRALSFESERNELIDEIITRLEQENIKLNNTTAKLKSNPKTSKSKQVINNEFRRDQNERAIQLIREYGSYAGEIADDITTGAVEYAERGRQGLGELADRVRDSIRKGIGEGRYRGLQNSGDVINSNLTAQIGKFVTEFEDSKQTLAKYMEGPESKGVVEDNEFILKTINGKAELDPAFVTKVIEVDEQGNKFTVQDVLDEIAEKDRHIEFIKRCQQ